MSIPSLEELIAVGDQHFSSGVETPMRPDAFALSDSDKIEIIAEHFRTIMETLGLDMNNESLRGTPYRVAKMYVEELFAGLNPANKPDITLFDNTFQYSEMLIEKNITVHSMCEHHFVPIIGKAHVAYLSSGKVIGLSKMNRIVRHFAKRPQVQERLTIQIAQELAKTIQTEHVAVVIEARHFCVGMRGIEDSTGLTITCEFSGDFQKSEVQQKFLQFIQPSRSDL